MVAAAPSQDFTSCRRLGLVFIHLSKEDEQKLEAILAALSGSPDMRTNDQRKLAPEDPLPFQDVSGNTVRPVSSGGSSKMSSQMSGNVTRTIEELNQVEQGPGD